MQCRTVLFTAQVACGTGSPVLNDRVRFPRYFQLSSSELRMAMGFYGIIKEYGWRRVALIVQDENDFTMVSSGH